MSQTARSEGRGLKAHPTCMVTDVACRSQCDIICYGCCQHNLLSSNAFRVELGLLSRHSRCVVPLPVTQAHECLLLLQATASQSKRSHSDESTASSVAAAIKETDLTDLETGTDTTGRHLLREDPRPDKQGSDDSKAPADVARVSGTACHADKAFFCKHWLPDQAFAMWSSPWT